MNEKTKETYKDPIVKVYACCPLCSATLLQAEFVKNGVTKCENCHQRICVDIENGIVHVAPFFGSTDKKRYVVITKKRSLRCNDLFFMSKI